MIQLPPDLTADDGPVVAHDTIRQLVLDLSTSHMAVTLLAQLLRDSSEGTLHMGGGRGLALLLEGAEARMNLALDGLRETVHALGVQDAPFPEMLAG